MLFGKHLLENSEILPAGEFLYEEVALLFGRLCLVLCCCSCLADWVVVHDKAKVLPQLLYNGNHGKVSKISYSNRVVTCFINSMNA